MLQKLKTFGIIPLAVFILFSSNACKSKIINNDLTDTKEIVLDYLKRLKHKDKSLLTDLNSISSENLGVNGWIEEYENQKGFYVQFENLADEAVFIHRPDYSIYSNIYKKNDKNWVGINMVVYPDLPYVILPHNTLEFHFPFTHNFPEDINLEVTFSIPQYTNIANDGELQYSEYRLIKQFTIGTRTKQTRGIEGVN